MSDKALARLRQAGRRGVNFADLCKAEQVAPGLDEMFLVQVQLHRA